MLAECCITSLVYNTTVHNDERYMVTFFLQYTLYFLSYTIAIIITYNHYTAMMSLRKASQLEAFVSVCKDLEGMVNHPCDPANLAVRMMSQWVECIHCYDKTTIRMQSVQKWSVSLEVLKMTAAKESLHC